MEKKKYLTTNCYLVNDNLMVVADSIARAVELYEDYYADSYGYCSERATEVKQIFSGKTEQGFDDSSITLVDKRLFQDEETKKMNA